MGNFLHYKNWSKLLTTNSDFSNYVDQKRNVLFSQFCIIGTLSALLQGTYDLIDGFPYVMLIDILFASILLLGYYLNEHHKHILAKLLVLTSMNILLFAFASVVPKGVGMFLLFYPLVAFSFISFDFKHRKYSYGFMLLSLLLNAVLVITNYQPFGDINLQPSDPTFSFALNLLISLLLLGLGIDFMLKINNTAEGMVIESQQQTEKLAREINEKNLSLEKTNEELDRFVYSTSHDLRAPLASVLGLINLTELEKDTLPPKILNYLEMMKDRVNNLDDFIQDIIDYSRNSRVDIVLANVNLKELVEDVISHNRFLKNTEKISIEYKINVNKPVMLDRNRVFRVLNNLVSNAIKYNDLSKDNPRVFINLAIKNQVLKIEVKDTGKGISDEVKDKIFGMFFRGTQEAEGSGLGLYIAKEMAEKMNGTLTLETKIKEGSTFTLAIPLT